MISSEEKEILDQADSLRLLTSRAEWGVFKDILEKQMAFRRQVVESPLHLLTQEELPGDFSSRASGLESIKGTMYGLRLALQTPHDVIAHAEEIRGRLEREEEEEKEDAARRK